MVNVAVAFLRQVFTSDGVIVSCNQKRRAIRSSENQTDGVGSSYDFVAYHQVKIVLSES